MAGPGKKAPHDTIKLTPVMPDASGLRSEDDAEKKGPLLPPWLVQALPGVVLVLGFLGLNFTYWKLQTAPDAPILAVAAQQEQIIQETYENWLLRGGAHAQPASEADLALLALHLLQKLASPMRETGPLGSGGNAVFAEESVGLFASPSVRLNLDPAILTATTTGTQIGEFYHVRLEETPGGGLRWKVTPIPSPVQTEHTGLPLFPRRS